MISTSWMRGMMRPSHWAYGSCTTCDGLTSSMTMSESRSSGTRDGRICSCGTLPMNLVIQSSHDGRLLSLTGLAGRLLSLTGSDGHEDSPNAPPNAYSFLKSLDPYHPISLCLNCQNYWFQEYSAGADILMADTYPIGTNTEFSTKYK